MGFSIHVRYFNFPVQLLKNFLADTKGCLSDISNYAIYENSLKLTNDTFMERLDASANYFEINFGDLNLAGERGKKLYNSIDVKSPKVGLNLAIYWDFYKNEKTEFEKVSLLAFLALKSIVQKKPYCKVVNVFWLSRMSGNVKSSPFDELPETIRKYANEYQTKKLKRELMHNWGLVSYSRYTRGFYVSFSMNLDNLVFQAEKRRSSNKEKTRKLLEQEAVNKALIKLGVARP